MVQTLENEVGLFPGNGTQKVGMSKDFLTDANILRELQKDVRTPAQADLIERVAQVSVEGPAELLEEARYTQAAIVLGAVAAAKSQDAVPQNLLGHSLGWISSAALSGAMTAGEATELGYNRGGIMQVSVPTGTEYNMIVVMGMIDSQSLESVCISTGYEIANVNREMPYDFLKEELARNSRRPNLNQFTTVGRKDQQARFLDMLATRGADQARVYDLTRENAGAIARAIPLKNITLPFHSSVMRLAQQYLRNEITSGHSDGRYRFQDPQEQLNLISTTRPGEKIADAKGVADELVRQVPNTILWAPALQEIAGNGANTYWGFGNGANIFDAMVQGINPNGHTFKYVAEKGPAKVLSPKSA